MIKKLHLITLFLSGFAFSQGITVNTTTYTPQQLITDVMMSSECATVSNIILFDGNNCGIGYFNANGSNFPFAEGLMLRNGNVMYTAGPFTDANNSTMCSNLGDPELQAVSNAGGGIGTLHDVTYIKFDIIPESNILSFNFIFSSNEYGIYQCSFGDVFAFLLTDLTTGITTNLAVIPGTTTPVSTLTIRDNANNGSCPSVNPGYFGQYNIQNPNSDINMRGQTVPMTAIASVIPNHAYSLKLAIGDYNDSAFDSAVFIEGGSFAISNQCRDNIQLQAFVDGNANGVKDDGEVLFSHGKFTHQVNNAGDIIEQVSSTGTVVLFPENISDTYDLSYTVDDQYAPYYTASGIFSDISIADGSGTNIFYFPVVNTAAFSDAAVSLIPMSQPRPTMTYKNKVSFTNNGVSVVSGTITFQNDTATTISEISQIGTIAIPGGFTYDFTDLLPNETRTIDVTLLVSADATIGQLLTNTVSIATGSDIEPTNNSGILAQETVNSFDPNDKTESHGGKIVVADFNIDDYLEYTIHFQNIGTANAINIRIEDILDEKLDETTLQMLDASHGYVMDRVGSELNWRFDGINLVGQLQSETLSQGYVHFRIKPKAGYAAGDIILNTAGIYFDNNPAVITNVAQTEFVEQLGMNSFNGNTVRMYPNPAHNTVNISANVDLSEVRITDMVGKTVMLNKISGQETAVDISPLQKGVYFVEIMAADQKTIVRKLVID